MIKCSVFKKNFVINKTKKFEFFYYYFILYISRTRFLTGPLTRVYYIRERALEYIECRIVEWHRAFDFFSLSCYFFVANFYSLSSRRRAKVQGNDGVILFLFLSNFHLSPSVKVSKIFLIIYKFEKFYLNKIIIILSKWERGARNYRCYIYTLFPRRNIQPSAQIYS